MGDASNREPRRAWNVGRYRARVPCASCGAPVRLHSAELPFCHTCLPGVPQRNLAEWGELGADD